MTSDDQTDFSCHLFRYLSLLYADCFSLIFFWQKKDFSVEAECQLNTKHHSQTTAAGIFISEEDESRSKICLGQKKKSKP